MTDLSCKPTAVDLFCGAGGLSYGLQQAGIEVSAGIDLDPDCRHPFETNVGAEFCNRDLFGLSPDFVRSLWVEEHPRVLAGCAPCQPFSTYTNSQRNRTGDQRNDQNQWQLVGEFGRLAEELRPEIVTMENVALVTRHDVFKDFVSLLERSGYRCDHSVVRCSDYGVPQRRRRLVLLASRLGDIELDLPDGVEDVETTNTTVEDAIGHLEPIEAGGVSQTDPLHRSSSLSEKNLQRIRSSKPGGTWRDWDDSLRAVCHIRDSGNTYSSVYGRMRWDEPAPTITTQFNSYGTGRFGHPEQDRALSLREGALLQTFPEDYSFVAPGQTVRIAPVARLIGNAVPVKLGTAIGRSIVSHLETVA